MRGGRVGRCHALVAALGIEAGLLTVDPETHIVRLVDMGLDPEEPAEDLLRQIQIRKGDRSQSSCWSFAL